MKKQCWFLLGLIVLTPQFIMGQTMDLNGGTLEEIILEIEKAAKVNFNFDPASIKDIELKNHQKFDLSDLSSSLDLLLQETNIDFEISDGIVMLLPPSSNQYQFCGTILDSKEASPLSFTHVFFDNHHGAFTDEEGYFEFNRRALKNDKLSISYLAYQDTMIYCGAFKNGCIEILLEPDPIVFSKEIIIRDFLFSAISQGKEFNGINFNMQALNHELGALEKDVLKSVQFLPGISSLDETASNLSIRGSEPDQNLILWEGVPLYNTGHFFGLISSVNPFVVNQLNVYSDSYSSSYDNRIGGVIDINLLERIPEKIHAGLGSTFTEAHGELTIPLLKNKLGLMLSGRKSHSDNLEENLTFQQYGQKVFQLNEIIEEEEEEEIYESNIGTNFYDLNAKLLYSPSRNLKFSSALFHSSNTFDHATEFNDQLISSTDSLWNSTFIIANHLQHQWSIKSSSSIKLNYSTYSSSNIAVLDEALEPTEELLLENDNNIVDYQLKLIHQQKFSKFSLEAGYILDRKEVNYEINKYSFYEADLSLSKFQDATFHHIFTDLDWQYHKWYLNFGNRISYLNESGIIDFSPRLSLTHLFNDKLNFRFSTGIYNQFVSQFLDFSQSELNLENRTWTLNTDTPMRSFKLGVGGTYDQNGLLIDADLYYHQSMSVPVLTTGQSSVLEVNGNGSTVASGLELLIKKRWNNLSTGLSYHLGYVNFILSDLDTDLFPSNNDQRHNLSLIGHYKWKAFNFSMHYALKSGLPYSNPSGITLIQEFEEDYYEVEIENFNDQRLSYYRRFDTTVAYNTSIKELIKLDLQLSLFNVFGTQNSLSRSYILSNIDQNSAEPEIFEVEKFQLGRTPQILIRISF